MTELIIKYAEPKAGEADSVVRPMEVMGELVRCKDCKYRQYDSPNIICRKHNLHCYENDFCSWAKMKGEK